jgi:dephospho-CoA kinase
LKIWGLTGSIGMGKSTAARAFRRLGVPVFDADAAVHALQAKGGRAVRPIGAAFPGTVTGGAVDREALRRAVLGDPAALKRLEAIVHPLVRAEQRRFLARWRGRGARLVVLDIPLLFETRRPAREFDAVIVVSAPAAVQRAGAGAAGDDRIAPGRHSRPPDARRREAPPRDACDPHRPVAPPRRGRGAPPRRERAGCVRSCSTPRRQASSRPRATASSRSRPSSCTT